MSKKIGYAVIIACMTLNTGLCSSLNFSFLNQQDLYSVKTPNSDQQVPMTFSGVDGSICQIMWENRTAANKQPYTGMCNDENIALVMSDESAFFAQSNGEEKLMELGMAGNYLAQYYLAQHYGSCAKGKRNGERLELNKKKAILLLISGAGYGFHRSLSELKFILDDNLDIEKVKEMQFSKIEEFAGELAKTDKL